MAGLVQRSLVVVGLMGVALSIVAIAPTYVRKPSVILGVHGELLIRLSVGFEKR